MTQSEIEKTVIMVLKELQAGTGDTSVEITSQTIPLQDLDFFDSLLGIETTILLDEKLGIKWNEDSVFTEVESTNQLSVAQIAVRLMQALGVAA
jgi:hypothetical protein